MLAGLDIDAGQPLVDLLVVVVGACPLEDILDSLVCAVGDLQVEVGNPDVQLLGLLLHTDGLDGPFGHLSRAGQVVDLHLRGHVSDPQLRRVRLTQQETLVVAGSLWPVDVELGRLVDDALRFPPLLSLLAWPVGNGADCVVVGVQGLGSPVKTTRVEACESFLGGLGHVNIAVALICLVGIFIV